MERILVSMDTNRGAWKALSKATSLARRTGARIFVLLICTKQMPEYPLFREKAPLIGERLGLMMESAKSEGIWMEIFMAEGDYEEEVIRFVNGYGITHLILEAVEENPKSGTRCLKAINSIKHRVNCRVELIQKNKRQKT